MSFTTILSKLGPVTKQVLGTYAPLALKTFGGPFGGLAGTALEAIFGTQDPTALEAKMAGATPDQIVALKKVDADLEAKMRELGIEEEDLYLKDTQDARAMQIATRALTPAVLAFILIGGFMLLSAGVITACFVYPDKATKLLAGEAGLFFGTLFGYLMNEAKQAAAFYFGSTLGSQEKDKTLAEIAKQ